MDVGEIKTLFLAFCDEADTSFLTDAQTQTYLRYGYDVFRNKVSSLDPNFYSRRQTLSVSQTGSIDLSSTTPVLLGSGSVAGTKISRLNAVHRVNSEDQYIYSLTPAASQEELYYLDAGYQLAGNHLHFSKDLDGTIRLDYVPTANISWATDTAYVDDLTEFHDLIVYYAFRFYAIRDLADNVTINNLIIERENALQQYLGFGRSRVGDHVGWQDW